MAGRFSLWIFCQPSLILKIKHHRNTFNKEQLIFQWRALFYWEYQPSWDLFHEQILSQHASFTHLVKLFIAVVCAKVKPVLCSTSIIFKIQLQTNPTHFDSISWIAIRCLHSVLKCKIPLLQIHSTNKPYHNMRLLLGGTFHCSTILKRPLKMNSTRYNTNSASLFVIFIILCQKKFDFWITFIDLDNKPKCKWFISCSQLETIVGDHGLVVITRDNINAAKIVYESDLLSRLQVRFPNLCHNC